jgi:hypothetical protein
MNTIESKSILLKGSTVSVQRIKVNLSSGSQGWYVDVQCSVIACRTQRREDCKKTCKSRECQKSLHGDRTLTTACALACCLRV